MKIINLKSLSILTLIALFGSGCATQQSKLLLPEVKKPNISKKHPNPRYYSAKPSSYYSSRDDNYKIKPEPYSLEKNERDPELLGPQSTIKKSSTKVAKNSEEFLPKETKPKRSLSSTSTMTKSKCISLIGKAKFDEYTKKFGSESAALRRCIILERIQKH